MPTTRAKSCKVSGCGAIAVGSRCEKHTKEKSKRQNSQRLNSNQRGYTYKWWKYAKWFLRQPENALCVHHKERGELIPATEVDHIVPHKGDKKLFWDKKNHQGLCKSCHSYKTATEDSSFSATNSGKT